MSQTTDKQRKDYYRSQLEEQQQQIKEEKYRWAQQDVEENARLKCENFIDQFGRDAPPYNRPLGRRNVDAAYWTKIPLQMPTITQSTYIGRGFADKQWNQRDKEDEPRPFRSNINNNEYVQSAPRCQISNDYSRACSYPWMPPPMNKILSPEPQAMQNGQPILESDLQNQQTKSQELLHDHPTDLFSHNQSNDGHENIIMDNKSSLPTYSIRQSTFEPTNSALWPQDDSHTQPNPLLQPNDAQYVYNMHRRQAELDLKIAQIKQQEAKRQEKLQRQFQEWEEEEREKIGIQTENERLTKRWQEHFQREQARQMQIDFFDQPSVSIQSRHQESISLEPNEEFRKLIRQQEQSSQTVATKPVYKREAPEQQPYNESESHSQIAISKSIDQQNDQKQDVDNMRRQMISDMPHQITDQVGTMINSEFTAAQRELVLQQSLLGQQMLAMREELLQIEAQKRQDEQKVQNLKSELRKTQVVDWLGLMELYDAFKGKDVELAKRERKSQRTSKLIEPSLSGFQLPKRPIPYYNRRDPYLGYDIQENVYSMPNLKNDSQFLSALDGEYYSDTSCFNRQILDRKLYDNEAKEFMTKPYELQQPQCEIPEDHNNRQDLYLPRKLKQSSNYENLSYINERRLDNIDLAKSMMVSALESSAAHI